jgi:ABC-type sugar transport system ATPase subunit
VLEARGIVKRYGDVAALAGVDLRVGPGEIVALAGENGSGKSTLAKVLSGAVRPDAGAIELDGASLELADPRAAIERGIAMVAQELTAVPDLTVAENVLLTQLPGSCRRFTRRALVPRAQEILAMVGVECGPLEPFAALRPGDRELVEVGKALATRPRLLILDEATSRLGERHVERLFDLVRRLRDEGMSTILITHRLREICDLADRAVVLRDGELAGELDREGLEEQSLSRLMVGRELKEFFHKRTVAARAPVLEVDALVAPGTSCPVSFTVRGGEVVGLAGLVGSGRTELLETIAGGRRAAAGSVTVNGVRVAPGSPAAAIEAGIALVPEDRHGQGLVLDASLRENVSLGRWRSARLARKPSELARAEQAVERLRIKAPDPEVPVRSLSGGNQQKVVIARCLERSPAVLLLDEPARGIDVGAKEEIFTLIGDMLAAGLAIVLVSSDMLEVLGLSDRVLVLHERRVVGELAAAAASEEEIAFLAGGGRVADAA